MARLSGVKRLVVVAISSSVDPSTICEVDR